MGSAAGRVSRLVPILDWLPRYDRSLLRGDLLAGIAVAAMIVPKDLGYAGIAGVPVQNGLYAAAAGAIVYAVFCTSRHISTGPSSALATVAGGAVLFAGVTGAGAAEMVAAITLVTGALFLLLALLRLGWVAHFLSRAVVTGFLAGAAVDVVVGELPKLTGTSNSGDNVWREFGSWVRSLDDISWTTLLVGLLALGLILGLRFFVPRVPGALVLVVAGLLATSLFDLGVHGVALVGPVPRGLPAPTLPSLDVFRQHYTTILAVVAVIAVLSAGVLAGVVIGITLSLVWLVYVATAPSIPVLGREPGTDVFRDVKENPGDETFPGIVVLRLDGGLFFATADALEE